MRIDAEFEGLVTRVPMFVVVVVDGSSGGDGNGAGSGGGLTVVGLEFGTSALVESAIVVGVGGLTGEARGLGVVVGAGAGVGVGLDADVVGEPPRQSPLSLSMHAHFIAVAQSFR